LDKNEGLQSTYSEGGFGETPRRWHEPSPRPPAVCSARKGWI